MPAQTAIRLGILALPLSGLLLALTAPLRDPNLNPFDTDPLLFAQSVTSTSYEMGWYGATIALVLNLFGIFGFYAYIVDNGANRLAFAAMVMSIAGAALLLMFTGIATLVLPTIGEVYLQGQRGAVVVASDLLVSLTLLNVVTGLLYSAGFIILGIAIRRSGIPKRMWIPLVLSAPLLSFPLGLEIEFVGAVLLAVGGGWIALRILRQPSAERTGVEASSRVQ